MGFPLSNVLVAKPQSLPSPLGYQKLQQIITCQEKYHFFHYMLFEIKVIMCELMLHDACTCSFDYNDGNFCIDIIIFSLFSLTSWCYEHTCSSSTLIGSTWLWFPSPSYTMIIKCRSTTTYSLSWLILSFLLQTPQLGLVFTLNPKSFLMYLKIPKNQIVITTTINRPSMI